MYAGCVAGAIQKDDYIQKIKNVGFQNIIIQKEKTISLPDDILIKYLNEEEINEFRERKTGIFSITVYAEKTGAGREKRKVSLVDLQNKTSCCGPKGCC